MKTRRIYDVSMSIRDGMVSWFGDAPVKVQRVKSMSRGDRLNMTRLDMSAHTGTHMDAPVHFVDGAGGIDTISPSLMVGPTLVVEVRGVKMIGENDLKNAHIPAGVHRLILKTDNVDLLGKAEFNESYSCLASDGAKFLVDMGIQLIGIDYLSVAEFGKGDRVHRILLTQGVVIVKGLDLRGVPAGMYHMVALPLKISGADGAPARVVLFSQ